MNKQVMHGEGTFFFANGDMLDGTFVDHKVLTLLALTVQTLLVQKYLKTLSLDENAFVDHKVLSLLTLLVQKYKY
jgi:hypothetical protein